MWRPRPRKPTNTNVGWTNNTGKVRVPRTAYTSPPEPIPHNATDDEYHQAIRDSGLYRMMTTCYPLEASQNN